MSVDLDEGEKPYWGVLILSNTVVLIPASFMETAHRFFFLFYFFQKGEKQLLKRVIQRNLYLDAKFMTTF